MRLLLASLLGGLIGLEREVHGRPAGFRTHLLVSLGACLFVITSIEFYRLYGDFSGKIPVGVDPGRVAAQVVTGIGFLGAGAILRDKTSIRGLTTAACLWVAAALGVACGIGFYALAFLVTFIALASLMLLKPVEKLLPRDTYLSIRIWGEDNPDFICDIEKGLAGCRIVPLNLKLDRDIQHRRLMMAFQVKVAANETTGSICDKLGALAGVVRVSVE
ncbi:MgtC/SapB family protein [Geomonas sp. Red875]|uniref:MgtC/SapB family protein n=2 Tax=Geomesophilobacter sediminis TaxID=2798584 RepID=A0A8J7M2P7_9BACT|nr:MgtC/SapB family protein [Geomesophilobacter sediminis]